MRQKDVYPYTADGRWHYRILQGINDRSLPPGISAQIYYSRHEHPRGFATKVDAVEAGIRKKQEFTQAKGQGKERANS